MEFFWFVVRFLVVTVGFAAVHLYVWRRLVRDTTAPGSRWRPVGAVTLAVLAGLGLAARFLVPSAAPLRVQELIGWPGWLWFGMFAYLAGVLVLAEPVRWWLLRRHRAGTPAPGPAASAPPAAAPPASAPPAAAPPAAAPAGTPAGASTVTPAGPAPAGVPRRVVLSRAIGAGATVAAAGIAGYGLFEGYRTPPLREVSVPLDLLGRRFDGYRIAVVGDTHLSAIRGRRYCQRVVDQINRTRPDLIAFVGDLASGEVDELREATGPLAGLSAREGAFFVAGNAEHYVGADAWIARVEELGLTALPNTRVELPGFDLAGVNDLIVEQRSLPGEVGPDLAAALAGRDPARASILMAHQPNVVERAMDEGVDLQLSGHTHGGQMLPLHLLARMRNVQLGGLRRHGGTQLYVTNGAGTNGPPMRVGATADITVMTLRSTQA